MHDAQNFIIYIVCDSWVSMCDIYYIYFDEREVENESIAKNCIPKYCILPNYSFIRYFIVYVCFNFPKSAVIRIY